MTHCTHGHRGMSVIRPLARLALCLGGLIVAAPEPARPQALRVVTGDRELARAEAFRAGGAHAYPLTLLTPLGAKITQANGESQVTLFGDTLRFRTGHAVFLVNGRAEPLYAWTFEKDGVLFVAQRFFTQWLPSRYPERLTYQHSTVRLATAHLSTAPGRASDSLSRASVNRTGCPPGGAEGSECPSRPDSAAQATARPRPWGLYVALYNVYDSNIEHNEEDLDSYGILVGVGGRYATRGSLGAVELLYDGVYRNYTESEQWNQPGHLAQAELDLRVSRQLILGVEGEVSLNGSAEDRVLRDEYSVEPRIEYRPNRQNRLRLYGEYLVKRYRDPGGRDAVDPRVGIQFRQVWGDDRTWTLGARYEYNQADSSRYQYNAWTFGGEVTSSTGTRGRMWWSVRYRARQYTSRLVDVGDTVALRRDDGWIATFAWEFSPWSRWDLSLNYRYELYNSNDPDRAFRAHTVAFAWRRWW